MNLFKTLLQARRQSDAFKLALILFILAGYFLWAAAAQTVVYAEAAGTPTEYILASPYTGGLLEAGMEKLRGMEAVTAVALEEDGTLRVTLEGWDLSGTVLARIQQLGFYPADPAQTVAQNYETQLMLTRLGYRLTAALLAVIAGTALVKLAKIQMASP